MEPPTHHVTTCPSPIFHLISHTNKFISFSYINFLHSSFSLFRFSVDGVPIRDFKNLERDGVLFPKSQPMRLYSSLWDADNWATRGGQVKTDWSKAPFTASYRNFQAHACVWSSGRSNCGGSGGDRSWFNQQLDVASQKRLKWVQRKYMIYNYCADAKRFPQGFPPECSHP